jgi:hypothetical protein
MQTYICHILTTGKQKISFLQETWLNTVCLKSFVPADIVLIVIVSEWSCQVINCNFQILVNHAELWDNDGVRYVLDQHA